MNHYCGHLVSGNGERLLLARSDARVQLRDRAGVEIWDLQLKHPVLSCASTASPSVFFIGTWGGTVAAFDDRGVRWQSEIPGAISMLATSGAETLVAGTWAGEVRLIRHDCALQGQFAADEAVVAGSIDPGGERAYVGLVDGQLIGLRGDGSEVWRERLSARPVHVSANGQEVFATSVTGELLWLDRDGREVRRTVARGSHGVASSRGGATTVWVDRTHQLHFWQPNSDRRWDVALVDLPDALVVTEGEDPHCLAFLPDGTLLVFEPGSRCHRETLQLSAPIRSVSISHLGVEVSVLLADGNERFFDLEIVRTCLPPAEVLCFLSTPEGASSQAFAVNEIGSIALDVTNAGRRAALDVEVRIESEHILKPVVERIGVLAPGANRLLRMALEPIKAGELPINIAVRWIDGRGNTIHRDRDEFILVTAKG